MTFLKRRKALYATLVTLGAVIILFITLWIRNKSDDYLSFRAEGLPFREAAKSGVKYARKYHLKNLGAHDTIKNFFEQQHKALSEIKALNRALYSEVDCCGETDEQLGNEILLSVAFVGDIMWIRNGWNNFLHPSVKEYMSRFDMVIGNLESPVDTLVKVPSLMPDYAKYNSCKELIRAFRREDGRNIFTALSLANNHVLDQSGDGLLRTVEFLNKEKILWNGVLSPGYLTIHKEGLKIGFYATSWGLNNPAEILKNEGVLNYIPGIAPLQYDKIDITEITGVLEQMKSDSVDFKIVYLHWGYEYELYPDPQIMRVGRLLAAAGADIVAGSHPHIIQPTEICLGNGYTLGTDEDSKLFYTFKDATGIPRKSLIIYSLGNFTTAMYTPLCRTGEIRSVKLYKNALTGLTDWGFEEQKLVYNSPPGKNGRNRKLLFLDDYLEKLYATNPKRAERVIKELENLYICIRD